MSIAGRFSRAHALLAFLLPASAMAQAMDPQAATPTTDGELATEVAEQRAAAKDVDEQKRREDAHNTLAAPPNLQQGTLPGTTYQQQSGVAAAFVLEGGTDEKTGTAAVGWKTNQEEFRLSAKGPLDKKTQQATPLSMK